MDTKSRGKIFPQPPFKPFRLDPVRGPGGKDALTRLDADECQEKLKTLNDPRMRFKISVYRHVYKVGSSGTYARIIEDGTTNKVVAFVRR
jgi:hypothetical protein